MIALICTRLAIGCAIVGALLAMHVGQARADQDWQFVLPEPGAEHEYPPLRAIPLGGEKPDDLKEKAEYRGSSRRYAQLRYGSPNAARVAIVVDQISPGEVDLYVDANRNRTIEAQERAAGEGRLWRVPLNVEYAHGEVFKRFPRELVFRLGRTGRTLSYAAAGYLEGKLSLAGADPPLPPGEGRGEGAKLPLPPGEGRGEGGSNQQTAGDERRGEGGSSEQTAGDDGKRQGAATSPHPNPLPEGEGRREGGSNQQTAGDERRGEGGSNQQAAGDDGKRQGAATSPHPNPRLTNSQRSGQVGLVGDLKNCCASFA